MRMRVLIIIAIILLSQYTILTEGIEEGYVKLFYRSVTVYAPAVAKTSNGLIGRATTIRLTVY